MSEQTTEMNPTDLSTLCVDLIDSLDGIQVINARVETNLIENSDSSGFSSFIKLTHGRRNIRGGHYVGFTLDGSLDNIGVVGIRDE